MFELLVILSLTVVGLIASIALIRYFSDSYSGWAMIGGVAGVSGLIACGALAIAIALCSFNYLSAPYQARLINQEFGTHYTKEDVFFAGDVIDEIRELKRTRIEVKGDQVEKVVAAAPTR